jgi:hypothetical protein
MEKELYDAEAVYDFEKYILSRTVLWMIDEGEFVTAENLALTLTDEINYNALYHQHTQFKKKTFLSNMRKPVMNTNFAWLQDSSYI